MALKIIINAIGKITEPEIVALYNEYLKRIKWKVQVNEYKNDTKVKEAKALWPTRIENSYVIAMDEAGKQMGSSEFAALMAGLESSSIEALYFLIGGANGHEQQIRDKANMVMSLSKMTLPHKMARLVLIEQIYRAFTINTLHPYHRV